MARRATTPITAPKVLMGAATLALAAAFTVAPSVVAPTGYDGAAYAKGGNGNGNDRSGERSNRGGKSSKADKSNRGGGGKSASRGGGGALEKAFNKTKLGEFLNRGQQKKASREAGYSASADTAFEEETEVGSLHPKYKGRYNARPNQNAIDAHIRNQNFNGTVGLLSQEYLALKAVTAPEQLSDSEIAALQSFGVGAADPATDQDIADYLNEMYGGETATYSYDGTTVSCEGEGCDGEIVEKYSNDPESLETEYGAATDDPAEMSYEEFLAATERRLIENANKSLDAYDEPVDEELDEQLDEEAVEGVETAEDTGDDFNSMEERLLDDIASNLGFDRSELQQPAEDLAELEDELIEEEEELPIVE